MSYDLIFLDADDTLFDFGKAEAQALTQTCAAFGLPDGEAVVAQYSAINLALWKRFEQGAVTQAQLRTARFAELLETLGATGDPAALNAYYTDALGRGTLLLDGALELCRTLAAQCPLYILTNGVSAVQKNRLAGSALAPYITRMFISQELGAQKPQREFFDRVFDALGSPDRARAILLGDSLTSDMAGAKNAGIAACWFNPADAPCDPALCDYHITRLADFLPICLP